MTPEYIITNWTDEKFELMCEKLAERKRREADAWKGKGRKEATTSDVQLFQKAGNLVKVVKK